MMVGGGVLKRHSTARFNVPPIADLVPAGTSALYSVAIGKRPVGSKSSVFVPTQRHLPGGVGVNRTGTICAASSCDVTATIGWEKVTERFGARATSPSGACRTTSSAPAAPVCGPSACVVGGNGADTVLPVRGGGRDFSRSAKSRAWPGSGVMAGSRPRTFCVSSSVSSSAGPTAACAAVAASSTPSLRRKTRPSPLFAAAKATPGALTPRRAQSATPAVITAARPRIATTIVRFIGHPPETTALTEVPILRPIRLRGAAGVPALPGLRSRANSGGTRHSPSVSK